MKLPVIMIDCNDLLGLGVGAVVCHLSSFSPLVERGTGFNGVGLGTKSENLQHQHITREGTGTSLHRALGLP